MENQLESILFPVEKVIATSILPKGYAVSNDLSFAIVGDMKEGKRLINMVSGTYNLIPVKDVFLPVIELLQWAKINHSVQVTQIDYKKFYLDIKINEHPHIIGNNDKIFPRVRVTHSYDCSLKYTFTFGWYRAICSNGLVLPVKEKVAQNYNIEGKHTFKIKEQLELFLEKIDYFTTNVNLLKRNFEVLSDRVVNNPAKRIEEVLRGTGFITKENKTDRDFGMIEYVQKIAEKEMKLLGVQENKFNDWFCYNGINHYIHNNDLNKKHPEFREKSDRKVFEFILG